MEKICLACNTSKPLTEFHTDRSRKDELAVYCKPCTRAKVREYATHAPRRAVPEGMRHCEVCKETKPVAEFYVNQKIADGLSKRCKTCSKKAVTDWRAKNRDKHRASSKKWAEANPTLKRDVQLKTTYGLPFGSYDKMLADQKGVCAICQAPEPGGKSGRFHVDHDHETKVIRGLLCNTCNLGIGHLKHREDLLQAAIEYLQASRK